MGGPQQRGEGLGLGRGRRGGPRKGTEAKMEIRKTNPRGLMTRRMRKRVKMGIMMPLRMGAAPRALKTPRTLKSRSLCQKNLKSRKRMTVLLPNETIEAIKMSPLNPKMIEDPEGQALERKEDLVKGDRDQDLGD